MNDLSQTDVYASSRRGTLTAGSIIALFAVAFQVATAQSNPVNLERLVRDAGIIFAGQVVDVKTGEKTLA